MKYCTSCGAQMNDTEKYCTACGALSPSAATENTQVNAQPETASAVETVKNYPEANQPATKQHGVKNKKPKKKGKVWLVLILTLLLFAVIGAGMLVIKWYTSPEQKTLRALDSRDYELALEIMEEDRTVKRSEELEEKLRSRIQQIKSDFASGAIEYAAATMELESISNLALTEIEKDIADAKTYMDAINESRTCFSTAESFFATGDYAEAIENYRLVIEDDLNYDAALSLLVEATELYREELLQTAQEYAENGLYSNAIAVLEDGLKTISNDTKLSEQIRIYEKEGKEKLKEDSLAEAEEYEKNEDYLNAYKVLSAAIERGAEDAVVSNAANEYKEQYIAQILNKVDALMDEKKFDEAASALNQALKELPNDTTLDEKLDDVNSKKPISITELLAVNISERWSWNEDSPVDPFGNDYSAARNYVILGNIGRYYNNHYVEYRLYGKYAALSGDFSTHIDTIEGSSSRLQIYADDVLIYTSKDMGRKTDTVHFTVDLTGVEYVKIVVLTEAYNSRAILSDVMLWPE